jgi:hypothetical protein
MIKKYIMYHASGLRVDVVEAKADATHDVQLAVLGVTGSSGLTGYETAIFARDVLKLRNAVCMDGCGSRFTLYKLR